MEIEKITLGLCDRGDADSIRKYANKTTGQTQVYLEIEQAQLNKGEMHQHFGKENIE